MTSSRTSSTGDVEKNEAHTPEPVLAAGPPPTTTAPVPSAVPPPPNGGTKAWLQVLGAFFLNFNTWGMLNTFGIFQSVYATGRLQTSSPSAISWIGSLQAFLMLFVGVVCGRALDAGYFYPLITIGVVLEVVGIELTSISTQYYQIILAQGVAVGIGAGMCFVPSVAIVGTYFTTRRSTALGIAATGSSIGGIIYPIALKMLISDVGLAWAIRIMGFIMLGTLAIPLVVMKPRLPPRKSGPFINVEALRDPAFAAWLVAVFFIFIGLYIPFFYVSSFGLSIGVSDNLSFYLLIIMNAASVPGRILPSFLADKIGNMSVMIPAVLLSGIIAFGWIAATTQSALIAVAVLFGFTSGSIQGILPATVPFLCPDLSKIGTNIGMTLMASGFGLLIGSPVAGAILGEQSQGSTGMAWSGTWAFAATTVVVGASVLAFARVKKVGFAIVKA